jgi:hypothetical protein
LFALGFIIVAALRFVIERQKDSWGRFLLSRQERLNAATMSIIGGQAKGTWGQEPSPKQQMRQERLILK